MSQIHKFAYQCIGMNISPTSGTQIEIIKECIEAGIDINSILLINVIQSNNNEIIIFLMENGINIRVDDDHYLELASLKNNVEIVKLLLEYGADPNSLFNNKTKYTCENIDIIRLAMEYGGDPISKSSKLLTNLCYTDKNILIVEYLISIGGNCSEHKNAPIIIAFMRNSGSKIKRLLLENGANPNIVACDMCLLEFCVFTENIDACKLLFEFDVDVNLCHNIINKNYAVFRGYRKKSLDGIGLIVDLFMEHGLDITEFVDGITRKK